MTLSIWAILLSVGVFQGCFLAGILLFQKRGRRSANQLLALLVFLVAVLHSGYVVQLSELWKLMPAFPRMTEPFWFLLGPLFYGYVRLLTGYSTSISWKAAVHLLPFCIKWIPILHSYISPDTFREAAYLQYIYQAGDESLRLLPLLYSYLFMIQVFIYAVLSTRLLMRYERGYKDNTSNTQVHYIHWLRIVFAVFAGYLVYETIASLLLIVNQSLQSEFIYLSVLLLSSFLFLIAYMAIGHPDVLFPAILERSTKYQHSSLATNYVERQLNALHTLMEEKQPYLRGDLKLDDLAGMLQVSSHHLTQLLNQHLEKSFYDFVNDYRVQEAQRRLIDPAYQHYTILAVALDVGFNSKTTFNRLFKSYTQMTPSQFQKTHQLRQVAS